jgi:hypothetical protein
MLPLGARFALSARTAAEAYYTQKELSLLGYGITIDAGLGANFDLGHDLGRASLRILTRVAPRFAEQHPKGLPSELADGPWLPATSEWVGFGASFARGRVDVPPGSGREACYILDGAIGWLWPQSGVGYRAQAGFGVSLLGGDLLSVLARAGNVESFGRPALGASVAYALSWEQ